MDEAVLIRAAQRGDLDSFNRLVLAYQDSLYNAAYRILGDSDSAADAVQEAFLSAFRKIRSYRGGSFRAWLFRILTNACYDELRRRKRRSLVSLEPLNAENEEMDTPRWLADDAPSPEARAEMAELDSAIQQCLDALPPDFRSVVVLVDIQGLDYKEAALALRKALGTIKSRLARARRRLQECLQQFRELLPAAFRLEEERP